jgi:hypothetical protein
MVEGYMLYQSMVYISKCVPKLAVPGMHAVDHICDVNSIKQFEDREYLLGKGRMKKLRGNILIIVEIYIYIYIYIEYMFMFINIIICIISSIINIYHG